MTGNALWQRAFGPRLYRRLALAAFVLLAGGAIFFQMPAGPRTIRLDDPPVWDFAWSPDGKIFAYCGYYDCHLLDAATGAQRVEIPGTVGAELIRFSPDGSTLILTAQSNTANSNTPAGMTAITGQVLALADARTGAPRGTLPWPFDPGRSFGGLTVSFDARGTLLAVAQVNGRGQPVQLYTMPDGKPWKRFMPPGQTGVDAVALSPDGGLLAMAVDNGRIVLVPVNGAATPIILHYDMPLSDDTTLTRLAFSPDGNALAAGFDSIGDHAQGWPRAPLLLWRLASGGSQPQPLCGKLASSLSRFAWRPDGQSVALADGNGTVELCPVEGGSARRLAVPDGPAVPAFSPDGKRLAVAAGARILVFNLSP